MNRETVRGSGCGAHAASPAAISSAIAARSRSPDSRCLRIATGANTGVARLVALTSRGAHLSASARVEPAGQFTNSSKNSEAALVWPRLLEVEWHGLAIIVKPQR